MKASGTSAGMILALSSDEIVEETFIITDTNKDLSLSWIEVWSQSNTNTVLVKSNKFNANSKAPERFKINLLSRVSNRPLLTKEELINEHS